LSRSTSLIACLDVGSTWTKLAVVDVAEGRLVTTAAHPTTVDTDVLDGVDALLRGAGPVGEVRCCSSAGGGLRLAVVGYEALVSAEAAHRVALSAGARVVHVAAGRLDPAGVASLKADRPDVLLLVGGTDGGDADVLLHNAHRLARSGPRVPVVVAGNADARDEVVEILRKRPVTATGNVLPRIGTLDPRPARAAIRDVFLRHVIGGKRLSKGPRFARLVRAATPDAVLTGVEALADSLEGDLLVVDVGGATTDVYSALTPDERVAVAGTMWRSRTVEGDLGVRWSAHGVVAAARAEKLPLDEDRAEYLAGHLDGGGYEGALDYAAVAATVAVRRHARSGRDLRDVRLVVASGGVFRHASAGRAIGAIEATVHDHAGGWALPRAPMITVDADYVLAPAGLLAGDHPDAAAALLRAHLHVR
jgi:MutL protein